MTDPRRSSLVQRTIWTLDELEADRLIAIEQFRRERLEEPLEEYLERFDEQQAVLDDFIERTVDLSQLAEHAAELLTDKAQLRAFRYLAGPPISEDDLKTLVDTNSLAVTKLRNDPDLVQRLVETIRAGLDRRRFPWVSEGREPSTAEREAAILASAALMAMRDLEASRRNESKRTQEERVRDTLLEQGFSQIEIPRRHIGPVGGAPQPGEFCMEVTLGNRKADLVVRLWDQRIMPIECKVSNSYLNSVKRLNNDAAAKAEVWLRDFGARNVVPVALLSGVFKLHNLEDAQGRGLTLYWAHRPTSLTDWIERTRSAT